MSTDFVKNTVSIMGGILPTVTNAPGDVRCRVETEEDIFKIPNPYIGMIVYVIDTGKRFEVLTLKDKIAGMSIIKNAAVDTYRDVTVDLSALARKDELQAQHTDLCNLINKEAERAQAAEINLSDRLNVLENIDHKLFAVKADVDAEITKLKVQIDEEKPYLADIAAYPTSKFLFACGQPMTVEPNTGFKYDANYAEDDVAFVYRWNDGFECIMVEKAVAEKVYVVGGFGDKNVGARRSIPQTNILVRDVKIKGVVGGCYFEGMVGHVDMELENCELVAVMGGGWCGASVNGKATRMNIADDVKIKATNCKISSTLFGGSQGNGVVDDVHMELNNCEIGWLTAGGSNGMTRDAVVEMNGGSVKVAQSTNRGVVHKARFILNDGVVNKLYFGGETEDSTVNGLIEEGFVELNGGTVKQFAFGTNGGTELAAEKIKGTIMDCVVEAGNISMLEKIERHPGFVRNDEFAEASKAIDERLDVLEAIDHEAFASIKYVDEQIATHDHEAISNEEIDNMINQ